MRRRAWLTGMLTAGVGVGAWAARPASAQAWSTAPGAGRLAVAPSPGASPARLLERARSAFNEIEVVEQGRVRTMYFVRGPRRFIESRVDLDRPHALDLDYARTMMAGFVVAPNARSVLMVGLGGGAMSNAIAARLPGVDMETVDIDPEVVRLARRWFGVPERDGYRNHVGDGRVHVERSPRRFDLIMLDAFRGVFVPEHLKTRQFYEAVRAHLNPGGVVVANLHNLTPMYGSDRLTFDAVFEHSYAFASESGNQTTLVCASGGPRVTSLQLRAQARTLTPLLGFDVEDLAARHYVAGDWLSTAAQRAQVDVAAHETLQRRRREAWRDGLPGLRMPGAAQHEPAVVREDDRAGETPEAAAQRHNRM